MLTLGFTMNELRKSIWGRLSALAFIFLIIIGNIWFSYYIVGQEIPWWLIDSFYASAIVALVGLIGMIGKFLIGNPTEESDDDD
tara:strand:- start:317 stop:568 length:252 start_codon:yes stop_codon:yes gene_type:complete